MRVLRASTVLVLLAMVLVACSGSGEGDGTITTAGGALATTAPSGPEPPAGSGGEDIGLAVVTVGDRRFEFPLRDSPSGLLKACGHLDTGFIITGGTDSQGIELEMLVAAEEWVDLYPDEFGFQKPRIVIIDGSNQRRWTAGGLMDGDLPHVFPQHSRVEADTRTRYSGSGSAVFVEAQAELTKYLAWDADRSLPDPEPEVLTGTWEFECPD